MPAELPAEPGPLATKTRRTNHAPGTNRAIATISQMLHTDADMRRRIAAAYAAAAGPMNIPADHNQWGESVYEELSRFLSTLIFSTIIGSEIRQFESMEMESPNISDNESYIESDIESYNNLDDESDGYDNNVDSDIDF